MPNHFGISQKTTSKPSTITYIKGKKNTSTVNRTQIDATYKYGNNCTPRVSYKP